MRDVSEIEDELSIQRTELYMQGANRGQGLGYELHLALFRMHFWAFSGGMFCVGYIDMDDRRCL